MDKRRNPFSKSATRQLGECCSSIATPAPALVSLAPKPRPRFHHTAVNRCWSTPPATSEENLCLLPSSFFLHPLIESDAVVALLPPTNETPRLPEDRHRPSPLRTGAQSFDSASQSRRHRGDRSPEFARSHKQSPVCNLPSCRSYARFCHSFPSERPRESILRHRVGYRRARSSHLRAVDTNKDRTISRHLLCWPPSRRRCATSNLPALSLPESRVGCLRSMKRESCPRFRRPGATLSRSRS